MVWVRINNYSTNNPWYLCLDSKIAFSKLSKSPIVVNHLLPIALYLALENKK